jgi:hypothetical protein
MDIFGVERINPNQIWLVLTMSAILLAFLVNKLLYGAKVFELVKSGFSRIYRSKYFGESQRTFSFFNLSLFFFQVCCAGMFVLSFFKVTSVEFSLREGQVFGIVLLVVSLGLILKNILVMAVTYILGIEKTYSRLLAYLFNYLSIASILFLPIVLFYLFRSPSNPVYFWWILSFYAGSVVFCWSILIYKNKTLLVSNLFYFILYLCTFEIAPLVIIFKALA